MTLLEEIIFAGEAQCVCLSVLIAKADLTPLLQSGGLTGVEAVAVVVNVEAGLAEEDAGADALRIAMGVDGVLGELCSCLTKAAVAGSQGTRSLCSMFTLTKELPSSSRNILRLLFLVESTLGEWGPQHKCIVCRHIKDVVKHNHWPSPKSFVGKCS